MTLVRHLLAAIAGLAGLLPATGAARGAPAPQDGSLRLDLRDGRLAACAALRYAPDAAGEASFLLGRAFAISSVSVDGRPATWQQDASAADSTARLPATWARARTVRVTLPPPLAADEGHRIELCYSGPLPEPGPWAFRLRPGDLFHPVVPGLALHWMVVLPGAPPVIGGRALAQAAGNSSLDTPVPVPGLYLLGPRPGQAPPRAGEPAGVVCLAASDTAGHGALTARVSRLFARACRDWGPCPWPTLAIVPDPARGDRPRAYPGVVEIGRLPDGVAGDAALLHELLHAWFGLGVAPPARGDWSEGLCTLLADHDLRAAADPGAAAALRRGLLARFGAIAGTPADLPLREYAPGDTASDAVGYGKGLFFFLALRERVGAPRFAGALRALLAQNAGRIADWGDLFAAFATADPAPDLAAFFAAWLDRRGAPLIRIREAGYDRARREVRITVSQRPPRAHSELELDRLRPGVAPWPQQLRLRLDGLSNSPAPLRLDRSEQTFRLPSAAMPASVTMDPAWECFRLLLEAEPPRTPLSAPGR